MANVSSYGSSSGLTLKLLRVYQLFSRLENGLFCCPLEIYKIISGGLLSTNNATYQPRACRPQCSEWMPPRVLVHLDNPQICQTQSTEKNHQWSN